MLNSIAMSIARPFCTLRSLKLLGSLSTHALVISPTTRSSLLFAQSIGAARPCVITQGPITTTVTWPSGNMLGTAAEIAQAFSGQSVLSNTILSFPDQMPGITDTSVMLPLLGQAYAFSTLEALLVLRHRPRVFALSTSARQRGFRLVEIHYEDVIDDNSQRVSIGRLMNRLLFQLCSDLAHPPRDWLARAYLAQKSERALWANAREELKDIECLLRMQLQSRFCDRERTGAALAAVVERQRILVGTALP